MQTPYQTTLRNVIRFEGIGLHSGKPAHMTLRPASVSHGVWFKRVDVIDRDNLIAALYDSVNDTQLCTRIANAAGVEVSTVEHITAALAGCGVTNVMIELDGPEVPIMDGSSAEFVARIKDTGLITQAAPRYVLRIAKPVEFRDGDVFARLVPSDVFAIDLSIDFPEGAIGHQHRSLKVVNGTFADQLSDSRTFCRLAEVDFLKSRGLALGGSLKNAIVVDGDKVVNPEGFRHSDECVRHKMLDVVGDLSLAGMPILGRYEGSKSGHRITNMLLRKLFATPGAFVVEECTYSVAKALPGLRMAQHFEAAVA